MTRAASYELGMTLTDRGHLHANYLGGLPTTTLIRLIDVCLRPEAP